MNTGGKTPPGESITSTLKARDKASAGGLQWVKRYRPAESGVKLCQQELRHRDFRSGVQYPHPPSLLGPSPGNGGRAGRQGGPGNRAASRVWKGGSEPRLGG